MALSIGLTPQSLFADALLSDVDKLVQTGLKAIRAEIKSIEAFQKFLGVLSKEAKKIADTPNPGIHKEALEVIVAYALKALTIYVTSGYLGNDKTSLSSPRFLELQRNYSNGIKSARIYTDNFKKNHNLKPIEIFDTYDREVSIFAKAIDDLNLELNYTFRWISVAQGADRYFSTHGYLDYLLQAVQKYHPPQQPAAAATGAPAAAVPAAATASAGAKPTASAASDSASSSAPAGSSASKNTKTK
jgi:hypothetical protein